MVSFKKFIGSVLLLSSIQFLAGCQPVTTKENRLDQQRKVSPQVSQLYQHALSQMDLGNHDSALSTFASVSKLDDSLSGPYVNQGLIHLKQGQDELAEKAFEEALSRNASNVVALTQLGVLQRKNGDFKAAKKSYEAALSHNANYPNAHLNLGVLCDIYLQDKQCALEHYQAYQSLQQDEDVNNWLIDLKAQL